MENISATSVCDGKERFEDPAVARRVAKRMKRNKGGVAVYRCRKCSGWHLGRSRNYRLTKPKKASH